MQLFYEEFFLMNVSEPIRKVNGQVKTNYQLETQEGISYHLPHPPWSAKTLDKCNWQDVLILMTDSLTTGFGLQHWSQFDGPSEACIYNYKPLFKTENVRPLKRFIDYLTDKLNGRHLFNGNFEIISF